MRVLYVLDRGILGGIQRHTQCLANCLKDVCDVAVCIVGDRGPLYDQMLADGVCVYALDCRNGHDWKLFGRFERILKEFKPDIIHAQVLPAFCRLWLRLRHPEIPIIVSLHTPAPSRRTTLDCLLGFVFGCKVAYYLPVSQATWDGFRRLHPEAKGEVFYNPVKIWNRERGPESRKLSNFVVGMVGRNADQKDWPSFRDVVSKVEGIESWGVGVTLEEAREMFGDDARSVQWKGPQKNGREWIGRMGLFILTSKWEEMPTVVLECFAERTPICGFIPRGGMREILSYSTGALKEVFIEERDCDKLADIVLKILNNDDLRRRIVEDGWQIVSNHFDVERSCRGRLMEIYSMMLTNQADKMLY